MTREQLEQQAESNRAAVADTLEELKDRLSPGQLIDQLLSYSKDGGNEFLGNLGRQVTANPMPVTLIGAGLAWFLFNKNSPSTTSYAPRPYSGTGPSYGTSGMPSYMRKSGNGIGETASAAADKIGDMASATASGVSGAAHSVGDAAANAYNQASDGVSTAYHQAADGVNTMYHQAADGVNAAYHQAADGVNMARDAASNAYYSAADKLAMAKDSAMEMEQRAAAAASSAIAFCKEQPLVLAGLGIAIGAAIGAALPSTQIENELMGETSDDLKESAKEMAVEQIDKAKEYGGKIGDALMEDIESVRVDSDSRFSGIQTSVPN
jgi:ElaB/YqjD/DUF883 family membrane-anchored ribosome-binding protein